MATVATDAIQELEWTELACRRTLDSLVEGFQVIDRNFRYVYVNPAAAAHGRTVVDALLGRTMSEAYPGIEQTPLYTSLERCMNERVALTFENSFTFADQSSRWFELRIEPVPSGICVHSVDVHERKMAQLALENLNQDLEALVEARTRSLQAVNAELAAFSYSVSHDLRAPLRSLDGFAQALVEDYTAVLDGQALDYLGRIRRASQRMGQLIDDLLSLSRVSASELSRRPLDLTKLAHEVAQELTQRHPTRRVDFVIEAGLSASCDAGLAKILLENLFDNAHKFTRLRELATVRFGASPAEPGAFVVEDDGAGFDMRYADKLFRPFQRLHTAAEFEGTGIGLATALRIVQKHAGSIRAESELGVFTRVTFRLDPRSLPPPRPSVAEGAK